MCSPFKETGRASIQNAKKKKPFLFTVPLNFKTNIYLKHLSLDNKAAQFARCYRTARLSSIRQQTAHTELFFTTPPNPATLYESSFYTLYRQMSDSTLTVQFFWFLFLYTSRAPIARHVDTRGRVALRPTGGTPREALRRDDHVRARGGAATGSHARWYWYCYWGAVANSPSRPATDTSQDHPGGGHISRGERKRSRENMCRKMCKL